MPQVNSAGPADFNTDVGQAVGLGVVVDSVISRVLAAVWLVVTITSPAAP